MIDAAERLRDARPEGIMDTRIYVYLSFPDMFDSLIEVAYEPNRHLFFNKSDYLGRRGDDSFWTEHFTITFDRIRDLGLRIPDGFNILGTGLRRFEADWMSEPMEMDEWVIGEVHQA